MSPGHRDAETSHLILTVDNESAVVYSCIKVQRSNRENRKLQPLFRYYHAAIRSVNNVGNSNTVAALSNSSSKTALGYSSI